MEFRLIKVELTVKVCGYQSTGRSAMCEHNAVTLKSAKIKNNSETFLQVMVHKRKFYSNLSVLLQNEG